MTNGISNLMTVMAGGDIKKSKELMSNPAAFEALLTVLLSQGMGNQGNTGGFEGDMMFQALEGMAGLTGSQSSSIDLMLQGMQSVDDMINSGGDAQMDITGLESLIKDLGPDALRQQLVSVQSEKHMSAGTAKTGMINDGTVINPENYLKQTFMHIMEADGIRENNHTDAESSEVIPVQDNRYNMDSEDGQYIVQRPEILRILKSEDKIKGNMTHNESGILKTDVKVEGSQTEERHVDIKEAARKNFETSAYESKDNEDIRNHVRQESIFNIPSDSKSAVENSSEVSGDVRQLVVTNKDDILSQIYDKAKVLNIRDSSELNIKLKPEALGEVSIRLVLEKGMMTGRILVENSHVKGLVESNLSQIKDNLRSQNLNVQDFSVSVGLGQGNLPNNHNFSSNRWAFNRKPFHRNTGAAPIEEIGTGRVRTEIKGLNLLA